MSYKRLLVFTLIMPFLHSCITIIEDGIDVDIIESVKERSDGGNLDYSKSFEEFDRYIPNSKVEIMYPKELMRVYCWSYEVSFYDLDTNQIFKLFEKVYVKTPDKYERLTIIDAYIAKLNGDEVNCK